MPDTNKDGSHSHSLSTALTSLKDSSSSVSSFFLYGLLPGAHGKSSPGELDTSSKFQDGALYRTVRYRLHTFFLSLNTRQSLGDNLKHNGD